ncbi:hypothetical protein [Nocardia camponoti]|uniref:Uncharacterized protein n=1 Tax=Nocardia camponoti TaxID=1616106 RepID=A0A917QUW5_9NOCA|nr:hypothetical protein [Nocardia camponoti]GGK69315.1 hypothetical protein GCM10011591_46790 [Nocardia camponoti]
MPGKLGGGDFTEVMPIDGGHLAKTRAPRTDRAAGLAARLAQTAEIILEVGETHDDQLIPVLAVAVAAQLSADPVVAGLGAQLSDLLASIEEGPLTADDGLGLLEVLNELSSHDLGDGVVPIPTVAVHEQWQTREASGWISPVAEIKFGKGSLIKRLPGTPAPLMGSRVIRVGGDPR